MDIQGRDVATECYRVTHAVDGRTVAALVPERLAAGSGLIGARPSHQAAHVWIAANRKKIEAAIEMLVRGGRRPRAPFHQITIIEET